MEGQADHRMTKVERLNTRVAKLLTQAVEEVLELVKETVSEYQQKTARTQRENENLRKKVQELQSMIPGEPAVNSPTARLQEDKKDFQLYDQAGDQFPSDIGGSTPTKSQLLSCNAPVEELKQEYTEHEENDVAHFQTTSALRPEAMMHSVTSVDLLQITNISTISSSLDNTGSASTAGVHEAAIKTETEENSFIGSAPSPPQPYPECVGVNFSSSQPIHTEAPRVVQSFSVSHHAKACDIKKLNRFIFDKRLIGTQLFPNTKVHLCLVCGKSFSRIGNLRIHQRCHTGERPYGCAQCGRRFRQAGDLNKHKRVHTGEKPYICNQCGKNFSRGENLKRHERIHIGETLKLHQILREQQQ